MRIIVGLVLLMGIFSIVGKTRVYADEKCMKATDCPSMADGASCICYGNDPTCVCTGMGSDYCDCSYKEDISIPGSGDWFEKVFGGSGIALYVFDPTNVQGEATFWTFAGWGISVLFVVLFIAAIAAIAIGTIKMASSGGEQSKLESGKKWFKNAVIGFAAAAAFFVVTNIALYVLGLGNIFDLAQNFAVCGDKPLYQYKNEQNIGDLKCTCVGSSWSCSP